MELQSLRNELIKMASLVEEQLSNTYLNLNKYQHSLALQIIATDRNVDEYEKAIETKCLHLFLKQQPVARDLRSVSATVKIITDLERIGDQASDISEITLTSQNIIQLSEKINKMFQISKNMVKSSIESFIHQDLKLIELTIEMDDQVDQLFLEIKNDFINLLKKDSPHCDDILAGMMVIKYLERIADHAVNICEWSQFEITGKHKNTQIL